MLSIVSATSLAAPQHYGGHSNFTDVTSYNSSNYSIQPLYDPNHHHHHNRRDLTTVTNEPSSDSSIPADFHTSHRIPDHIGESAQRQNDEKQFQTSHRIPKPPPPVVVGLHLKPTPATAAKTFVEEAAAGQRQRRDGNVQQADDESVGTEQEVAEKPTHLLAGLVFPVPVDQIVKHSNAAKEIHHHHP